MVDLDELAAIEAAYPDGAGLVLVQACGELENAVAYGYDTAGPDAVIAAFGWAWPS